MLESLFKKFAGLTTILKNISQRLLLYCTHTTRCYLSVYFIFSTNRSSHRRCSLKKGVLSNFAKGLHFIKKETLAQVFSCKILRTCFLQNQLQNTSIQLPHCYHCYYYYYLRCLSFVQIQTASKNLNLVSHFH